LGRFLLKRLASSIVTLWLLATILFLVVNVLPGNPGRKVLGPLAPEDVVVTYNHKFGVDRPLLAQYGTSMKHLITLNFGDSFRSGKSVVSVVRPALFKSAKLAVLALAITIPLSIAAGVFAARRQNRFADRAVVMFGLASTSMPDFVPAAVFMFLFGVKWKIGYVFADPRPGTSIIGQFRYLIFPALAMVLLYFGYIARMTRAGVISAMHSDYARTATMKGMSQGSVMRRHILRNALAPTITVISVQTGYLAGSILGVERVFNYHGVGSTILDSVNKKDIPVLQGAVLIIGIIYMVSTLGADLLIAYLNPRVRLESGS
jgi:peptide/nickel transport system permease protein